MDSQYQVTINGVLYDKQVFSDGYNATDGDLDQVCVKTNVCGIFSCQKWHNNVPVHPVLVKNHRGFYVCPVCCGSYGTMED